MSDTIEFKTSIQTKEFCRLRESVGFLMLNLVFRNFQMINTGMVCWWNYKEKFEDKF